MFRRLSFNRIWTGMLGVMLAIAMLSTTAAARDSIDMSRRGSITLSYPVAGIEFELYRVADISGFGEMDLTEEYSDYAISLEQEDQSGWQAVASALDAYIDRDKKEPLETKVTDGNGKLTFETHELGLYLIKWDQHEANGKVYTPQPVLVTLPDLDEDENWVYDIAPTLKFGEEPKKEEKISRRVHKIWKDNKNAAKKRPGKIEVQLLCDGEVYDTVELNEKNSWSHQWDDLDVSHMWKVVEKDVPSDYTVQNSQESTTFLMTNTMKPDEPDKPDKPGKKLPQTGVLWWPVPVMACVGLVLFSVGWMLRRRDEKDEK